jgi:hypothetical protein
VADALTNAGRGLQPTLAPRLSCTPDAAFPGAWDLPEASAAAEVELAPTVRELLVVADSGNDGDAMLWKIPTGPLRKLKLALDRGASDDLEGAAWLGGHLYVLTSSGAVRRFSPDAKGGLVRDQDAYAIGAPPWTCASLEDGNCGKNYEGLCLRAAGDSSPCAGYAASKSTSTLVCLVFRQDRLLVDGTKGNLKLNLPHHSVSDCAFGAAGGPAQDALIVTTNIYGGSATYLVDEASGALHALDTPGLPSNEAVAIDKDGAFYQFMDDNGTVSPATRLSCEGWPRKPTRL